MAGDLQSIGREFESRYRILDVSFFICTFSKMVFVVFAVVVAVVVAVVDFPVVSDTREPWFEISHKQLLLNN